MKKKLFPKKSLPLGILGKFKKKRIIKTCNILLVSTEFAAIIILAYKNPAHAALTAKEGETLFLLGNHIETAKLFKQPAYAFEPLVGALSTLIGKAVVRAMRLVKISQLQLTELEKTVVRKILMEIAGSYACIYSSITKGVSKLVSGGFCFSSENYLAELQMEHKIGEELLKNL